MKKLVIIPAYNESASIEHTVEEIVKKAPEFDYVIINDCSTDHTREICEKHQFNVINLPVNLGIGGAVQTGYKYGVKEGYDVAVQVDGDGQHDPEFLNEMFGFLEQTNANVVIGSRFINNEGFQSSGTRRIGIKYFTLLIKLLTGVTVSDPTSGLRMIDRQTMELFAKDYPKDYPEPESIIAVLRRKELIREIPVRMRERSGGVSSISLKRSVYYMVKVTLAILIERIRQYES